MSGQQSKIGWEHVDLPSTVFRSKLHKHKWTVSDGRPHIAAVHRSLTSALNYNGNLARNWEAEGGISEETLIGGVWLLLDGGSRRVVLALSIDYLPLSHVSSTDIETKPVKAEPGSSGKILQLHAYLER